MKFYTGVGSRQTPKDILVTMTKIAEFLYKQNYILRSGAAEGADVAFEAGAGDKKEIYLPWRGFNKSKSELYNIPVDAYQIAKEVHPCWNNCDDVARKLHARNVMQVYGKDLNTCSDFLICWTRNGNIVGGTATAIRLAQKHKIPVFNLAIKEHLNRIMEKL